MKKFLYLSLAFSCFFSFSSCTQENEEIAEINESIINSPQKVFISEVDTDSIVDSEKALSVAETFFKFKNQSRGVQREVESIRDVKDDNGTVLFFIINYTNNNGFVIVSANQNYIPILAFSDTGNFQFNEDISNGSALWVQQQKNIIEHADSLQQDLKLQYRALWSDYNIKTTELEFSRTDDDVYFLISSAIFNWRQQGYEVFRYSEINNTQIFNDLPTDFKNAVRNAVDSAHPDYGGRNQNTFILRRRNDHMEKVEPLLQTKWGQGSGFNEFIPNGYPVGCVAVAMGQIMKYHEYPESYSWNMMNNIYATSVTAQFLYEIGRNVKMEYKPLGSISNINNALSAFKNNYGYSDAKIIDHSDFEVTSQLRKNRPVYMRGEDNNRKVGHAWVCDGFFSTSPCYEYSLYILEDTYNSSEPTELSYIYSSEGPKLAYTLMLSYNWGWGGENDGYFYDVKVNIDGAEHNFSKDRKEIINIYPVK